MLLAFLDIIFSHLCSYLYIFSWQNVNLKVLLVFDEVALKSKRVPYYHTDIHNNFLRNGPYIPRSIRIPFEKILP